MKKKEFQRRVMVLCFERPRNPKNRRFRCLLSSLKPASQSLCVSFYIDSPYFDLFMLLLYSLYNKLLVYLNRRISNGGQGWLSLQLSNSFFRTVKSQVLVLHCYPIKNDREDEDVGLLPRLERKETNFWKRSFPRNDLSRRLIRRQKSFWI